MVKWTESFLEGRSTSITIGNKTSGVFAVDIGIPQGSPISPILFLFFNAPLIEDCTNSGLKVQAGGFVDDTHLMAYGTSTESNCRTLERAHMICQKWATKHGASFAPKKYELIHLTRSPKKFHMGAEVDLSQHQIHPKAQLKTLGIWIDGKLRWGPHIKETQAKIASQSVALTKIATPTWGATLNKARKVYTAAVRPAMTYVATIWHIPSEPNKRKGAGPIAKLITLQNKCLRSITGAYKATNIRVLEAEASVIPLDLHLDQVVLRSRDTPKCTKIIELAKARIRRKLRGKRAKKRRPGATPMSTKDKWVKEKMEDTRAARANSATGDDEQVSSGMLAKKWARQKWDERRGHYTVLALRKTPAHEPKLSTRKKLHQGLRKAESSLAVQLRTEKVGFAAFLYERKVPGVLSPACECGWRRQDPKHIIVFCPNHAATRNRLYEEAGTRHYKEMLATKRGLRAVAGWVMREGLLHQFSLAKEHAEWAENGKGEGTVKGGSGGNKSESESESESEGEKDS